MRTTIKLSGSTPPSEFRLFKRGWNATEHGKFLFDDEAARSVMSAYREWGIDLPIDLEHQMLDDATSDPTARDARGWCQLEVRADGSLWAVQVSWTADGAERLTQKRQRYVSPAFEVDPKTKRVTKMVNVSITALPATHGTPALIAASRKGKLKKVSKMPTDLIKQAIEAIASGDAGEAMDVLKQWISSAAGGTSPAPADEPEAAGVVAWDDPVGASDADGSEGPGAEGVAPPAKRKKLLSARQAKICKELGVSPARFLEIQRAFSAPIRTPRVPR